MRLISTTSHSHEDFFTRKKPPYAILSHRWRDDEVSFADVSKGKMRQIASLRKFYGTIRQAKRHDLDYVWIDSCSIDKRSSAELSESINSMYDWYRSAKYCYVYLHDVDKKKKKTKPFRKSVWFSRGWTLQELLAPRVVLFFDRRWRLLGDRRGLSEEIAQITGIDIAALRTGDLREYGIAQKMSWAAKRKTSRIEDTAYSLMGLFGVNMPLLYGEGKRAFIRLQEEIIKTSDDQSIFAWRMGKRRISGLLAPTPSCFSGCEKLIDLSSVKQPFSVTNRGLLITLKITPWMADTYLAYIGCAKHESPETLQLPTEVGIFLRRLVEDGQYARISVGGQDRLFSDFNSYHYYGRPLAERQLFVRQDLKIHRQDYQMLDRPQGFSVPGGWLPATYTVRGPSLEETTAVLPPGEWGPVVAISTPADDDGLHTIMLGYDFDFHPLCLLVDSSAGRNNLSPLQEACNNWGSICSAKFDWYVVDEIQAIYRNRRNDRLWAIKGFHLVGFELLLGDGFRNKGAVLKLEINRTGPPSWEFTADVLVGPFRVDRPQVLKELYGSREGFQKSKGLGMDSTDLEKGDAILEQMFSTISYPAGFQSTEEDEEKLSERINNGCWSAYMPFKK